jgi:hypothetical protein
MKIEAVGHTIETKEKTYKPGEQFDADDKEAAWLIKQGFAKKAVEAKPETKEEKAAREAAEKRKALEAKAVELKVGNAEEVKNLSDKDLADLIEKAESAERRKALEEKAVELKIGTAEEVKALSDKDLKDRVAKSGGGSFLGNLFGGAK